MRIGYNVSASTVEPNKVDQKENQQWVSIHHHDRNSAKEYSLSIQVFFNISIIISILLLEAANRASIYFLRDALKEI